MKIIAKGKLPEEEWIGVRGMCNHCHTQIEIENAFEVTTEHSQRDGDYSHVTCPLCQTNIAVYKRRERDPGFTH